MFIFLHLALIEILNIFLNFLIPFNLFNFFLLIALIFIVLLIVLTIIFLLHFLFFIILLGLYNISLALNPYRIIWINRLLAKNLSFKISRAFFFFFFLHFRILLLMIILLLILKAVINLPLTWKLLDNILSTISMLIYSR